MSSPGVVAGMLDRVAAGDTIPPWVPDGALALVDFKNGQYWVNGAERTLSTIVDGITGGDIDARGLPVNEGNLLWPSALGVLKTLLADLSSGLSVVVRMDEDSAVPTGPLLTWEDGAQNTGITTQGFGTDSYIDNTTHLPNVEIYDWFDLSLNHAFPSMAAAGLQQIGYTLGRDNGDGTWRFAISVNGEPAVSQDVSYSASANFAGGLVTTIEIGGWEYYDWNWAPYTPAPPNGAFISRVVVYAAKANAGLAVAAAAGLDLAVLGTPVIAALAGQAIDAFAVTAYGGVPGYSFAVHAGSLPSGLSLDASTGIVSGTPASVGTSAGIVLRATDTAAATADLASFDLVVRDVLARFTDHRDTVYFAGDPRTYSACAIGPADASRIVIVRVEGVGADPTLTIAGHAMAMAASSRSPASEGSAVFYYALATGTTADIIVTGEGSSAQHIDVTALYGVSGAPAHTATHHNTSGAGTVSASVAGVAAGITLGFANFSGGAASSISWDMGEELYDLVGGAVSAIALYPSSGATITPTATHAGGAVSFEDIILVSFGP